MFCVKCGYEISGDANFCPKCGQNLSEFKSKPMETEVLAVTEDVAQKAEVVNNTFDEPVEEVVYSTTTTENLPVLYDIIVLNKGDRLLDFIKLMTVRYNMGLSNAKTLIDSAPFIIESGKTADYAKNLADVLARYGVKTEIRGNNGEVLSYAPHTQRNDEFESSKDEPINGEKVSFKPAKKEKRETKTVKRDGNDFVNKNEPSSINKLCLRGTVFKVLSSILMLAIVCTILFVPMFRRVSEYVDGVPVTINRSFAVIIYELIMSVEENGFSINLLYSYMYTIITVMILLPVVITAISTAIKRITIIFKYKENYNDILRNGKSFFNVGTTKGKGQFGGLFILFVYMYILLNVDNQLLIGLFVGGVVAVIIDKIGNGILDKLTK